MLKHATQPLTVWFAVSDLVVTAAAWLGSYYLRFNTGWVPITKDPPDFSLCLSTLPVALLCATVAFRLAGQYDVHRLRRFREEMVAVVKGVALLTVLVMAAGFSLQNPYESRAAIFIFGALAGVAVLTARRLTWTAVRAVRRRGYNQARALVVGTGRLARRTARGLDNANWMGLHPVGLVDDVPVRLTGDLPILGRIADLPRLIEEHRVGHIFIALPMARYADARRVFDLSAELLVDVRLVVDAPDMAGLALTTSNLDGLPIVGLRESPHVGLNIVVKRAMDIVLASVALVVLAPLMLLIAVLVKLSSPGPVLFRQIRCGLNGEPFAMYKFRSMRADAEKSTGAVFAKKDDPRRTRLGTFLRKTSLDELPQFFNVLRGDMSLVGPRPERPEFVQKFRKSIPNYMARHAVKAGLTGWAQVNGWRGDTSLRKRVQFDLYYITHWNPLFDLQILVLTAVRGLFHRNAY